MDSDILNIEDIVMGRALPDPPAAAPPPKPAAPIKLATNGPPVPTVTSYQHENLQCFQCFITFCSAKAKERHMKKSHREEYKQVLQQGNTLFTCYVCDRTFSSSEELTQHQPTHSKDDKPFKCAHCKESFKTFSELTVHRRQQCPERQFPCKDCSETFRSAAMLRTHRLALHPRQEETTELQPEDAAKAPTCKKCGQSFESETEFLSHTEGPDGQCNGTATPKKRGQAAAADKKGKRKKKDDGEESEDPEKSAEPTGAAEEKGKSGGAKRGRPAKATAKTEDDDSEKPADEDQAKEKKPKVEAAASRQMPCPECDLNFPGLTQLRTHKKEKHTQKKAHPCEECEESFSRQEQLDAHMSRVHALGRFACSTCGKSFGRERTLKAHEKTHTEEENQAAKR
ncbi:zinc finger protein 576.2 [Eucyclogobius newberryi]|uniref:zinc finger protein 576.2 n=1 Tax=Eucyclogobius newberryi TaxID=166745 RepID=UPI003B59C941